MKRQVYQWFEESETLIGLILALLTIILAWFLDDEYHFMFVLGFLVLGILFDLLSLFYHIMTLVTKKFMSGVPIGPFFYLWFVLASRFSLVGGSELSWPYLLLYKLADLLVLAAFHALCELPRLFQGPRSNYR